MWLIENIYNAHCSVFQNWVTQNRIAIEIRVSFCGDNIKRKGREKSVYLNLIMWMCLLNVSWAVLKEKERKNVKWDEK